MKENVSDSIFVAPFKMKCQIEMRPFLRHRGLGVFGECLGYWFQEHVANKSRFSLSSENMQWHLGVLCRMPSKDENKRYHTIRDGYQFSQYIHREGILYLCRQLPLRFPSTSFKSRWPRFLKNLRIKKIAFDIIMGPACPRHCYGPRLFFLEGSTWLSKCVRALHFPLLGFETGLERETAWNYWDIFYKDLLQVTFDIRAGNTKDGWKKHGIDRQPFFWFGTPSNKITYDQDS